MGWLNFGGKKRKQAQGFGNSKPAKSRKRPKTFILEKIVTPSAGVGGLLQDFDALHQLLGALSLSDLDLPNFFADSGVCPIDPNGAPTNNLPPLIDFDPLGLYHDGIATQTPYNPGGAFETLPVAVIPVDPHSPNPNNPNAIRQLLDSPLASQPLVASIDTGVSADSPYLNYANIKKGRDYVGGDDNPLLKPGEGSEHGTFMLGIIDAINKTAPKWVGRAIDSGRWADSLVEFVDAAKASGQKNAIANLSLDLTQKNADGIVETRYELTPPERSAIEYARQNGVMLVVAAGNDGGVMSVLGQASQEFDNIFTVGAGDINGRSNYSSYGRGLDILADGGTTEHPGLSTVGNDLGTMAGTSVATAKVAGAASLVWAANPALNYRQVMEILKSTARDLGPSGWDDETGFGFLNTLAAVDLAKKTMPEVYNPTAFLKPTTWGGEGLVTPTERAVNIINENFTAWVVSSNGITLRNSPNTSDRSNFVVKTGDTLTFDGWTYGEQLSDLTTKEPDALWYRFRYNGGTYWVPSAWTGGYPGSKPSLLPPTQQPPQQPPQQPTANTVYLSTSSGQILQVNTATGAQNPIYQGRAFTDLAVAPNGKLYGCTFYDGLYEINPSTGAERYVGPLAGGTLNSLTFSTDGRLYGADQGNGNLFQISPDNGQMNLIGNLGGPSSGDLVFNGANEILATVSSPNTSLNDRLVAVNLATGNSRYIGDLGLLEVYGLSWENGQLTAYTSDRRKLAIDPNTARVTVVGTVSSNGLIWGAATKPATASSPTDDVRQKFLYAASQYPQVGAAITGMQDQGGGVFRQEFERAIMIWNGQQVTVYETKGRSVSPTSPSPTPEPVVSGKGNTIRTGASPEERIKELNTLILQKQKRITEIKNNTFWWISPANLWEIFQLELTLEQLKQTLQQQEVELKKLKENAFKFYPELESRKTDDNWWDDQSASVFYFDWNNDKDLVGKNNENALKFFQAIGQAKSPPITPQEALKPYRNHVPQSVKDVYTKMSTAIFGNRVALGAGYASDAFYSKYIIEGWEHSGIDLQGATQIKAGINGKVLYVENNYKSLGLGTAVAVQETIDGKETGRVWWYYHLANEKILVKVGDPISPSTPIGTPGANFKFSNGNRMGAHLHLTVATNTDKISLENDPKSSVIKGRTMSPIQAYWEAMNGISR
ncbi:S8 family serine peptidase [Microcoleus sp. AT8-B1]|uniref:S8 family serine peptidase n=1 Tax=unclassified Microcoleus TaxID=2642155 RepID=UPI002FCE80D2